MIVGASDRMISAPDIKFEPPQMKIFQFTPDVIALVAGDPYVQTAMCYDTAKALEARRIRGETDTVAGIARLYGEAFTKHRRERAENKFLKPVGLDAHEFLMRQSDFDRDFVDKAVRDMQCLSLDVETIIAGKDASGYHIYIIDDPGDVRCADAIGFASIGTGKNHANSQFMMARHTKQTLFHTALLQTYAAKKRAEVSPTVGGETDLFYVGIESGFEMIHSDVFKAIDAAYKALEGVALEARSKADEQVRQFIIEHLDRAAGERTASGDDASSPGQSAATVPDEPKPRRKPKSGKSEGGE